VTKRIKITRIKMPFSFTRLIPYWFAMKLVVASVIARVTRRKVCSYCADVLRIHYTRECPTCGVRQCRECYGGDAFDDRDEQCGCCEYPEG
jgi:hypothetical protein